MNRDAGFERAFVAVRYFLGARGDDLGAPLGAPSAATDDLVSRLQDDDRRRRAQVLADELGNVVRALDARSYR